VSTPRRVVRPLAALRGRVEVARIQAPEASTPTPPLAERWVSREFSPAPEVLGDQWVVLDDFGYRWSPAADGRVHLESNGGGEAPASAPSLAGCRQSELGDLTRLECDGAALLYTGRRLLVASFSAEAPAAADLLLRFRAGDEEHALVLVGLRTRRAVGLLFREGGAWRIALRPPAYPAGC